MDNRPIGVFDSGIGGLTVVNALVKTLPQEAQKTNQRLQEVCAPLSLYSLKSWSSVGSVRLSR